MLPINAESELERRRIAHPLRSLLATLLALVCVAGCSPNASASSSSSSPGGLPVISAMNGFSAAHLPPLQLDQQLAAMQAGGVQVLRSDAPWADIEPTAPGPTGPVWQFSKSDALVSALATHRLTWEPIIDYSVGWAKTCPGFCPPTTDATYAVFAQAVAARYGEHGSFWSEHPALPYYPARIFEIWNEENTTTFWSTGPNPARYAKLYIAARQAIRTADPTASVIVGGLGDDANTFNPAFDFPARFVEQMFAAQPSLKGNVDGFGLHPYGPTAVDVGQWVAHFREVLDSLGEGSVPIDLTEFGWTTGDPIRETWRATMMRDLAYTLSRSNCGIRMLAPYDWINPSSMNEPADFGFVDRSGADTVLRPAAIAWFSELRVAPSLPEVPGCPAQPSAAKSTPPAAKPPHKATRRGRKDVHRTHHPHHKGRRHQPPSGRRHA